MISKIIDIELGDYSRCQIKPENYNNTNIPNNPLLPVENEISTTLEEAENTLSPSNKKADKNISEDKIQGERLYSETCSLCSSSRLVRNGTCKVCLDCGTTTGCS